MDIDLYNRIRVDILYFTFSYYSILCSVQMEVHRKDYSLFRTVNKYSLFSMGKVGISLWGLFSIALN